MKKKYIHNYVYFFRQDFIKHPLEKPFVRVPDQYRRPEGEMEGMTSYKKEFTGNWTLFFSMAVKKIFKLYVIANKSMVRQLKGSIYIWFGYWFLETSCGKSIKLLLSNYYQRPFLWEETMLRIDHFRNQNLNSNIIVMQNLSIYADIGKAVLH